MEQAGWMGKKRDPNKKDAEDHVSRPLSTLKDPASFGPPPKNVNYHGGAALPNEITPQRGGWGAPLTQEQISSASQTAQTPEQEAEEEKKRAGPPLPYRADRTGLKTDHLPPPPIHRDLTRSPDVAETAPVKPKPGLPPRLPSRQNTGNTPPPAPVAHSSLHTTAPPAYEAIPAAAPSVQPSTNYGINQAAVSRLGNAGVSVPALGIGSDQNSNPWHNEQSQASVPKSPPVTSPPPVNQLSELQARFARMNSNSSAGQQSNTTPPFVTPAQSPPVTVNTPPLQQSYATQAQPQSQAQGTTWAEKQAAMRTAQNAYKDPASVSAADAGSAVRTANSFRERHQDSINAAGVKANQWNKKYNVTGRLNSFLEKHSSPSPTPGEDAQQMPPANGINNVGGNAAPMQASPEMTASISRKPPPPPPPKKPANMHGSVGSMGVAPPPVPLGTKPSYA
ncbi:hypothetical protein AYO22_11115 [Fonsecaea multimorphosa]|nr:hypothetical protein AYO22_11115 [Fonsecaea multimorphosa]